MTSPRTRPGIARAAGAAQRMVRAGGAALCLALAGCGTIDSLRTSIASFIQPSPVRSRIETLKVEAEPRANRNNSTRLDIVFLYEQKFIDQLPNSGLDWFTRKDELLARFTTTVDVVSLQVVPDSRPPVSLPERYAGAVRVMAYPFYYEKGGQTAGNLTILKNPVITLKPESIAYTDG